eukprot:11405354-Karenia_brevis.AAC.2
MNSQNDPSLIAAVGASESAYVVGAVGHTELGIVLGKVLREHCLRERLCRRDLQPPCLLMIRK